MKLRYLTRKKCRFDGIIVESNGRCTINCKEFKNIHVGRSLPPKPMKRITMKATVTSAPSMMLFNC